MPVVESYPSIVGIAQVAQAAGQGRYNKWLAEYNARSNQMSTNALMSGFQAGSSLGMSVQNMWQQQQQFAQRQGFIESQAATTLQKDTERAQAMIPALDPYVKQLYPHLNEEQRGAYIGSLDGRQLDAMTNNIGNASRSKAAYDIFGSPQAIRKQAKATYDKMVTGQEHHNQRVQARLEPLFQRMRDNDLGLNEESVQAEIAKILQEEGEAKGGTSLQEQADRNTIEIRDDNGYLLEKIVRMGPEKFIQIKNPQAKTTGTRAKTTEAAEIDPEDVEANVRKEWTHLDNVWEKRYGPSSGNDVDPANVGIITAKNGTHYRPLTQKELASAKKHGRFGGALGAQVREHEGTFFLPTDIPPRPTMEQARKNVMTRAGRGGGGPVHKLVFPHEWPAVQGAGGAAADQQPGQAMPTPPQPVPPMRPQVRRPDLVPEPAPYTGAAAEFQHLAGEVGRVRPGVMSPGEIDIARDRNLQVAEEREKARGVLIKELRAKAGNSGHRSLTTLIGAGTLAPTKVTQSFEAAIRSGEKPEDWYHARRNVVDLMDTAMLKEAGKAIDGFDEKTKFIFRDKDQDPLSEVEGFSGLLSDEQMIKSALTPQEYHQFKSIRKLYNQRRESVLDLAAAAVNATPPGQRVDVMNIPSLTTQEFDRAVQEGNQINVGDIFLMPTGGYVEVTSKMISDSRHRVSDREWQQRRGVMPQRGR